MSEHAITGSGTVRRMRPRGRGETHRAATPLELFFDLCFVVAVAQAGSQLAHDLSGAHLRHGILGYLIIFFGIWWAWMNFTWFASAYDTDDVPYRICTFVQIVGALILAAGVPRAFADADFAVTVTGYVVMRVALIAQWLRAARTRRTRIQLPSGASASWRMTSKISSPHLVPRTWPRYRATR